MGLLLNTDGVKDTLVPDSPPPEIAHATNFERFDGLDLATNYNAEGDRVYPNQLTPRPGQNETPLTYTPSPQSSTVGTLGGQPLPVANWLYRLGRGYTPGRTTTAPQLKLGKNNLGGQNFGGAAQTVTLSEITGMPPVPGDLTAIIAGQG